MPSDIEVYIADHKGPDPSKPEELCSQACTDRLAEYGQEMVRRHEKDYDRRKAPIDPMVVYATGGRKSHGRYSMFNGVIDSREVRSQRSGSSSERSGARTHRQSEHELEVARVQEEIRQRDAFQRHNMSTLPHSWRSSRPCFKQLSNSRG
uniref:Uncharacterized protein n=2 Tax=Zea mays TaxID=4577 RepID=B6UAS6_MAIZE|nr:hypothetical protein [Zea mays]